MANYWIGCIRSDDDHCNVVFRSDSKPTEESHGDRYTYCEGPLPTRQAAVDAAHYVYPSIRVRSLVRGKHEIA